MLIRERDMPRARVESPDERRAQGALPARVFAKRSGTGGAVAAGAARKVAEALAAEEKSCWGIRGRIPCLAVAPRPPPPPHTHMYMYICTYACIYLYIPYSISVGLPRAAAGGQMVRLGTRRQGLWKYFYKPYSAMATVSRDSAAASPDVGEEGLGGRPRPPARDLGRHRRRRCSRPASGQRGAA